MTCPDYSFQCRFMTLSKGDGVWQYRWHIVESQAALIDHLMDTFIARMTPTILFHNWYYFSLFYIILHWIFLTDKTINVKTMTFEKLGWIFLNHFWYFIDTWLTRNKIISQSLNELIVTFSLVYSTWIIPSKWIGPPPVETVIHKLLSWMFLFLDYNIHVSFTYL